MTNDQIDYYIKSAIERDNYERALQLGLYRLENFIYLLDELLNNLK